MMLGVGKSAFQGESKFHWAAFHRFSVVGEEKEGVVRGLNVHNCDCREGRLRRGVGVTKQRDSNNAILLTSSQVSTSNVYSTLLHTVGGTEEKAVFFADEDGYLHQIDLYTGRTERKAYCGQSPIHCAVKNEQGYIEHLFCSTTALAYTVDGNTFTTIANEDVKGACTFGGRVFVGTGGRKVRYTAAYAVSVLGGSSDEGGEIYLPVGEGEIVSLVADGDGVCVFTAEEIYRLTSAAKSGDFRLEKVDYTGGAICLNSAVGAPSGCIFLTEKGAYRLYGNKTERICERLRISPNDAAARCKAGVCGDLAMIEYATLDENALSVIKRVAINFDGKGGFFCERYGEMMGGDYALASYIVYRFELDTSQAEYQTHPYFQTDKLYFGSNKRKFLKRLRLEGAGEVKVAVEAQGKTKEYVLRFENGFAEALLKEVGQSFRFRIYPGAQSEVRSLKVGYVEEV